MQNQHQNQKGKTFNIKVGEFQGSLETLLEMVQKRKLNICNVSLAKVADDYVAYIRNIDPTERRMRNNEIANFIVIAATLLLIKSKSLLPNIDLSTDEKEDIKDLENRLKLYSIYKQANDALATYVKSNKKLYAPKLIKIQTNIKFTPANNLEIDEIYKAMKDVLAQLPKIDNKPKGEIQETIYIEEVMRKLLKKVDGVVKRSFKDITGGNNGNKQEILVYFLALLELVKDGVLFARQDAKSKDIIIGTEHV